MKKHFLELVLLATIFPVVLLLCQKDGDRRLRPQEAIATSANQSRGHLQQTKTCSSEVVQKWLELKIRF